MEHGEAGGFTVPFGTTRFLDLGAPGEKQRAQSRVPPLCGFWETNLKACRRKNYGELVVGRSEKANIPEMTGTIWKGML